jgi:hypothetical protein
VPGNVICVEETDSDTFGAMFVVWPTDTLTSAVVVARFLSSTACAVNL